MRKLYVSIILFLLIWLGISCTQVTTYTPTMTITITPTAFQKQPEPQEPIIRGEFSGLADDEIVTIYIHSESEQKIQWGTRRGNGSWESVVPDRSNINYIVTAEVEGYISTPVSYTIFVSDNLVALMKGDGLTENDALHLDFHFTPVSTTTPDK